MSVSLIQRRLATAEMPATMRALPVDGRGYPVPFIVMRDKDGVPHFTVNDYRRCEEARKHRLCAICGKHMRADDIWFVGGSRCFLHERGAFLDPPAHGDCAEYALRVCPFLAASSYARRLDDRKLDPAKMPDDMGIVREDFVMPRLPERFGLGRAGAYRFKKTGGINGVYSVIGWLYVEFWRAGEPCDSPATGEPPAIEDWSE